MNRTPHDMKLPWRVVEEGRFVMIVNANNEAVIREQLAEWSMEDKPAGFLRKSRYIEMVEANRRQLFKLEFIVAAANKTV